MFAGLPVILAGLPVILAGLLVSLAGLLVSLAGLLVRDDFCYKRLAIQMACHKGTTNNVNRVARRRSRFRHFICHHVQIWQYLKVVYPVVVTEVRLYLCVKSLIEARPTLACLKLTKNLPFATQANQTDVSVRVWVQLWFLLHLLMPI